MVNFRWIWQVLFNLSILWQCLSVYGLSTPTSLFSPKVNPIFCWLETQVQENLSSSSMQLRLCHALCSQQELDLQVQVCASSAGIGYLFTQGCLYRSLVHTWTYMFRLFEHSWSRELLWRHMRPDLTLCSLAPLSGSMKDCDELLAGNLTSLTRGTSQCFATGEWSGPVFLAFSSYDKYDIFPELMLCDGLASFGFSWTDNLLSSVLLCVLSGCQLDFCLLSGNSPLCWGIISYSWRWF